MEAVAWIAEQKIREAQIAGELDNIPGMGKPLRLDDESRHSEYWLANKILKNAGLLPYPMQLKKDIESKTCELDNLLMSLKEKLDDIRKDIYGEICTINEILGDKTAGPISFDAKKGVLLAKNETSGNVYHLTKKHRNVVSKKGQAVQALIGKYNHLCSVYKDQYLQKLRERNTKIDDLSYYDIKHCIQQRRMSSFSLSPGKCNIVRLSQKFAHQFAPICSQDDLLTVLS